MSSTRGGVLAERPLLRRSLRPLTAVVVVVVAGVAGFVVLGDIGVVEATFWLVDLTSIPLHFETHAGPVELTKAYALVVRTALVLSGLWFGETVLAAAFGGQIREELRQVQNERTIEDVADHAVICGYGMFGRTVAETLAEEGREVVAIERDEAVVERIREDGYLALRGDARRDEVLRAAGTERAAVLVAAIDDSNANVQIAIVARQLAPGVTLVVRVGDEMYETLARRAGADVVVIPEVVSAERLNDFLGPDG